MIRAPSAPIGCSKQKDINRFVNSFDDEPKLNNSNMNQELANVFKQKNNF